MKIAYTICSANYLPFAKSLADSLVRHNPGYQFVIALADTYRDFDPASFAPHQVISVEEIRVDSLAEMNAKYSIFELSCALKPFLAEFLFSANSSCDTLFYFDSDILVYGALYLAESALQHHSILLTPHIAEPLPYKSSINIELDVLRTGLYNAGFFGLKRTGLSFSFLNWWKERLLYHCFNDAAHGLFVDQLWLDLVPLYFKDTTVLYDPGYNLAYWNFNERRLAEKEGTYVVNDHHPLVFFHYSGYDIYQPEAISKHQKMHSFEQLPQYKPLFENYVKQVLENNSPNFTSLPVTMGKPVQTEPVVPPVEKRSIKQKLKQLFTRSDSQAS
jgi:hypothetical protein